MREIIDDQSLMQEADRQLAIPSARLEEQVANLLRGAHAFQDVASCENLEKAFWFLQRYAEYSNDEKKYLSGVVGASYMGMLDLNRAEKYISLSENADLLTNLKNVALWYGQQPKVIEKVGSSGEFKQYLERDAFVKLGIMKSYGEYYFDDDVLEFLEWKMHDAKIDERKSALAAASRLQKAHRSIPKQKLLELYSKGKNPINRDDSYPTYKLSMPSTIPKGRDQKQMELDVRIASTACGYTYTGRLQKGDDDVYFPVASNLFLVDKNNSSKEVWKEYLQLYVDFSKDYGFNQEKEILEKAKHPLIPHYYGTIRAKNNTFLRIEHIEGKCLDEYSTPNHLLDKKEVAHIGIQLCDVLNYLHSEHILYLDIKDKNILYDGKGMHLLDFGMGRIVDEPITSQTKVRSVLSTPEYIPKEWLTTFSAGPKSEVFQMGVLLYQLLTGEHPYACVDFKDGDKYRESSIIKYGIPNAFCAVKKNDKLGEFDDLVYRMLDHDENARPEIEEVALGLDRIVRNGVA